MWFWLSLIALLCWSGSDLFSKIGCQGEDDHLAHLKMVIAVGTVMGLHAAFEIFIGGTEISWSIIWTYLPVSLLYIGSMTLGYLGLRYIELSVSSPICNSSGALVAVMTLLFVGGEDYSPLALGAIVLVCVGAIGLGVVDATEDPELRAARQAEGNRKYSKSFLALALPVAYCLLDAAGTFADNRVLETLDESSANCAYELTFLFAAVLCFIYVVFIKKDRLLPKREAPKSRLGGNDPFSLSSLFDGVAENGLPLFRRDAARVGEIDLVVQADVVQVVFIPVFAQKCVHLRNGLQLIVE